jgi:hypothetical protein
LIVAVSLWTGSEPYVLLPVKQKQNKPKRKLLQSAAVLSLIFFLTVLTIPSAYFFQGFRPWLSGFEQFLALSQEGLPAFFFGEYSSHSWWSYFLIAFLIKTPVGSLILITISLVFYRASSPLGYRQALFLVLPVIIIFVVDAGEAISACVISTYPFLFVLASRLATIRLAAGCTLISTLVFVAFFTPDRAHQLAYFQLSSPAAHHRIRIWMGPRLKGPRRIWKRRSCRLYGLTSNRPALLLWHSLPHVAGTGNLEWPPPSDKVPADAPARSSDHLQLQDVSRPNDPFSLVSQPVRKSATQFHDLTNDPESLMKPNIYVKTGSVRP